MQPALESGFQISSERVGGKGEAALKEGLTKLLLGEEGNAELTNALGES